MDNDKPIIKTGWKEKALVAALADLIRHNQLVYPDLNHPTQANMRFLQSALDNMQEYYARAYPDEQENGEGA